MNNRTVFVDNRIYQESIKRLNKMGYSIIKIPNNPSFDEPISAHPDMNMVKIGNNWYVHPFVHSLFTNCDDVMICEPICNSSKGEIYEYPYDIYLNCAFLGNKIICNKKHTHRSILDFAVDNGIEIIDSNQGYSKCAICIVDGNSIITEDYGIKNRCDEFGIDVLLIEKGHVGLNGYDYGFIGGCCGLIENDILVFNGCIEKHPDYIKIEKFCSDRGVNIVSLSSDKLYDVGTIVRA